MQREVEQLKALAESIKNGQYHFDFKMGGTDQQATLAQTLIDLATIVEKKYEKSRKILEITEQINAGVVLDEILTQLYKSFRTIIPYDRIGLSLLEENGTIARSYWAKSESSIQKIGSGYWAPIKGSSLELIIKTGQPRIIDNLEDYLREHPESKSTQMIVQEGIRSSLTCPLLTLGKPVGFIFFSSRTPYAYQNIHLHFFLQIAGQLSIIIEKGRLYDELLKKNEDLKKLNELKSDFVATVSHELRTPLTIIKEAISQILDGLIDPITERNKKVLHSAYASCNRLTHIVDDILDISKLEAKRVKLNIQRVDLVKLSQDVAADFSPQMLKKGLELKVVHSAQQLMVDIDPGRIIQVLTNLISNALKFTDQGSIILSLKEHPGHVECTVLDTGCGINTENVAKAFGKFEQFGRIAGPGIGGTGLGLSICKQIIKLHQGEIWLESEINKGTRITFIIPKCSTKEYLKHVIQQAIVESKTSDDAFSIVVIAIHNLDILTANKSMQETSALLQVFESWLWQAVRPGEDQILRIDSSFFIILKDTNKKSGFAVAEKVLHVLNQHLVHEQFEEQIDIGWQIINFPEDARTYEQVVKNLKISKETTL